MMRRGDSLLVGGLSSVAAIARGDVHWADALRPRRNGGLRGKPLLRYSETGPIAILSPHLDDAVLSCWWALESRSAMVINVFDGVPNSGRAPLHEQVSGSSDSRETALRRIDEDCAAVEFAGATRLSMGFLSRNYRGWPLRATDLAQAIADVAPAVRGLLLPAAIGGHPDHVRARSAGYHLIGGVPASLYADLPYAAQFGWPCWVTGRPAERFVVPDAAWARFLPSELAGDAAARRVQVLPVDAAARKLAAMRMYESQYPTLTGPTDLLAAENILPYEVTWTLRDAAASE